MNTTPTPATYPTNQPISLLTREPLPEENPTPTETILEALIFTSPQEQQHAHRFTQQLLHQIDHEKLPLTLPLQRQIRATTMHHINAIRAQNNTLPREDGKPTPGAITNAATNAINQQQRACDTFEQLLQRHKLQHQAELAAQAEQQAREASQKEQDDWYHIHDTRVHLCGYPRHLQPQKLQSLADALRRLDQYNQTLLAAKQPLHTIPYNPKQLFPTQNAPYPQETYPPDPTQPLPTDTPSSLPPLQSGTEDDFTSPEPTQPDTPTNDLPTNDLPTNTPPSTAGILPASPSHPTDPNPTQEPQRDQDHPDAPPYNPAAPPNPDATPYDPSAPPNPDATPNNPPQPVIARSEATRQPLPGRVETNNAPTIPPTTQPNTDPPSAPKVPSAPSVPSPPTTPSPPKPRNRHPNLPPPRIATLKPGQRLRPF